MALKVANWLVKAWTISGSKWVPLSRVIGWELSILGSHGMAAVDYPALFALIDQGLDPALLVTRVVGRQEAARLMQEPSGALGPGIVVLDPGQG